MTKQIIGSAANSGLVKMPFTQSQITDIKQLISESIAEILTETVISQMVDKVIEKTSEKIKVVSSNLEQHGKYIEKFRVNMEEKIDNIEQFSRRNNIRIYGLKEGENENIQLVVDNFFTEKMGLHDMEEKIDYCHRIGKSTSDGKRAILVRLKTRAARDIVISNRKVLKGTQITVTEDMTALRHRWLKEVVEVIGGRSVWTLNGQIFFIRKGSKVKLQSREEWIKIKSQIELEEDDNIGATGRSRRR